MKIFKKTISIFMVLVMMLSLFTINSFAATIKSIEIIQLPTQTTFVRGTDWDYGYWKFPEGDGLGVFTERAGIISFMHQGGYFSVYQDRGMLDMNGLVVKVTYSDGTTKNVTYKETKYNNGVVTQNILASPSGGDYKLGENTIEIYFQSDTNVYTTYKINIVGGLKGDLDFDGNVNSTDALLVLKSSVQLLTLTVTQQSLADMNDDGKINSFDALLILQKSVGKI